MLYNPNEFIKLLLSHSKKAGFSQSECFYEYGRSMEISILNGEVSMFEASDSNGISFRGQSNGQMGYAFSEEYTDASMEFLLAQAKMNADVLESSEKETVFEGDKEYGQANVYSQELDELTFTDYAELGLELEKKIRAKDPRIVAVDHCSVSYGSSGFMIENTCGLSLAHKSNMMFVYAEARCEDAGQVKTGSAYWVGRDIRQLSIDALCDKIVRDTVGKLGASTVKSGKYNVVIDAEAAADLLSTFSGIFSADLIQKGFSLIGEKMNTRIAPSYVSIHDDASHPQSITSIPFDSEGVSTRSKTLVDKGILVSILHNRKTADKADTSSTGNGFRSGYKGSINIGTTNFYIEPGVSSQEKLFMDIQSGIYITELSGLHAGASIVSGDFSLSCEGYIIENGQIGRAVDQITIADNFYQLLEKIVQVGSDLYFNPPSESGSIGSPSLQLSDIAISGD